MVTLSYRGLYNLGVNIETLVVTDLDGTLWFNGEEIHSDSLAAVEELKRRNIPLLVATGRRLRSVVEAFRRYEFRGQAVLLNGSLGYCFKRSEPFFLSDFPDSNETRLREIFNACSLSPCFYADDSYVYVSSPTTSSGHLEAIGADLIEMDNLGLFPKDRKVLSFCILGIEKSLLQEAESIISTESLGTVAYYEDKLFGEHSLMVQPPFTSKWTGVEKWCQYYDIVPSQVIALGDAGNDKELLKGADIAMVVEDSEDYLMEMADYVIPPPSKGGWAKILDLV